MRKFILLVLVVLCLKSNAQDEVRDVLPDYFKNYYKIITNDTQVLGRGGRSNVHRQNFNGSNDQQWLIMPLHSKSKKALIVNRNGKVLDRSSKGNLYCNTKHKTYIGNNQLFSFDKKADGSVIILCDNHKVGDICMKGKKDPFKHPSHSKNNLYARTRHDGDNQRFTFSAVENIRGSDNLVSWRMFDPNNIDETVLNNLIDPLSPSKLTDNLIPGVTTNKIQIAQTYIPCVWVKEEYTSFEMQVEYSPYYIVK